MIDLSVLSRRDLQETKEGVFPSEVLDKLVTNNTNNRLIISDSKYRKNFFSLDRFVINDYAIMIDNKLVEAFKILPVDEFRQPKGFESRDKSSPAQKYYFNTRHTLEFFLINDVKQHTNQDAKLSAFRRWILISEKLLKMRSYDAFLLVFANVELLSKPHLIAGLPKYTRDLYESFRSLISADKNHAAMRAYIKDHPPKTGSYPVVFWNHAILALNGSIDLLETRVQKTQRTLNHIIKRINNYCEDDELSSLKRLERIKRKLQKKLKTLKGVIAEQKQQIESIINQIASVQDSIVPPKEQCEQQNIYQTILLNSPQDFVSWRYPPTPPNSARSLVAPPAPPTPTLYSEKLLPSFWSRRGKGKESYWEHVFGTGNKFSMT